MHTTTKSRLVLLTLLLTTATAAVLTFSKPQHVHAGTEQEAAAAARHAYHEKISAKYNYYQGKENPFLPSNMTTDTGEFIDPKSFPTAEYCGHCHKESHTQWRESAHSNSNRAPWYLKNVGLLNEEKGVQFSRHCEGCHDPVAVAAGAITPGAAKKRPYDQDGVTCSVCHAIKSVDTRGTGSYVLGVPAVLVDENGAPITRQVSDTEILTHLDRHSKAVMQPFYKTSEFCSSCHKAALPHSLNGYKWQRAISLYDEWQNSSFAKQSPLPFYTKDSVSTCETCHMQREALTSVDPGAKKGTLASHRWLGANTVVPQYYKFDAQAQRIQEFLKSGSFNIDVFGIEHGDRNAAVTADNAGTLSAPLGVTNFALKQGEPIVVDVVIQNKGIAHSHVPEQRDMYESWTAFTVKDATGKTLFESGATDPKTGELNPNTHSFTNRLININGTLNARHEVWNNRIVAYNNSIQSGRSQIVRYAFTLPQNAGDLTVTATVKYRRFAQHFMDFGMGKHYEQPVVDMNSTTRTLHIGENKPDAPLAAGVKDTSIKEWMRWNNYGIGLLDAQQYAASVDAFQHVAKLRPDYADAYTNQAIVEIQWEKYDDARPNLEKALALAPNNARALYYRALVERNGGELDAAITDLQAVAKQFPRSRDAHRELGFSYYQQHKYAEAKAEYLAVQSIDPDDLSAHYILSIVYRRLNIKPEAAREAAAFADQKDDPTANTYALEYLRKNPDIANESVVWHVNTLDPVNSASGVAQVTAKP